jgi:hypothetical protein
MYGLGTLEHGGCGFEFRSRHGCMSAFFGVVLFCVVTVLEVGRSPIKGILKKFQKLINAESVQAREPT